jgi:hypothetical protein
LALYNLEKTLQEGKGIKE